MGETTGDFSNLFISIQIDKEAKTLIISDRGIGMTEDEVEKYIAQVAFSGAEEFVEKYKDKSDAVNGIIGHFGLGFILPLWWLPKWKLLPNLTKTIQLL